MVRTRLNDIMGLIGWIVLCFAAAAAGGRASIESGVFYQQLLRPAWAPPAWLFGPVWTLLYAMMAVAAWLVWRNRGFSGARIALLLFIVQLVINALWTWIFFVWKQGAWAFVEIVVLWLLIAATLYVFLRVRPLAGMLLLPYLAWVTFAAFLTFSVWRMNPGLL